MNPPPATCARQFLVALGMSALAAGCAAPQDAELAATAPGTAVAAPSVTAASVTATPLSPTALPTVDPYAGLTIKDLAARSYGGSPFVVDRWTQPAFGYDRGFFHYASDGLTVHGFMNVPHGEGPFPAVLVLHGYIEPGAYDTIAYTAPFANALAREGYFVLHPNYRNYPPSEPGANEFRIGYAVDVLNLLAVLRERAGQPGPLDKADAQAIGLFGHSMGGGIALRVITVDPQVKAAVLYGSMSGDEEQNYARILDWSEGQEGWEELNTPAEDLARISPIEHLDRIEAAVSVHHGAQDEVVPPEWSDELCGLLEEADKAVECFSYPDMPHNFHGRGWSLLVERSLRFFDEQLSAG